MIADSDDTRSFEQWLHIDRPYLSKVVSALGGFGFLDRMTKLRWLNLAGTNIGNEGMKHLQGLTLLEEFDRKVAAARERLTEAVQEAVEQRNGRVQLDSKVVRINRRGSRIESVVISRNGHQEAIQGTDFISSMPVSEFVKRLSPGAPSEVMKAAERLKYRDFLTVCLIVNRPQLFPDNWIYIHDPDYNIIEFVQCILNSSRG
jgi:protoporphyrinogen oxidase